MRKSKRFFYVAYNCPDKFPLRSLEIIGTKAMAIATNTMEQMPGGALVLIDKTGKREEIPVDDSGNFSPLKRQIETFADCHLNEKPFPYPPAHDLATMQIIEGAMKSENRL
jgi:hypothetical protein